MASTGVRGITIDGLGRRTIDKEHRGARIFLRLGAISQDEAERRLGRKSSSSNGSSSAASMHDPSSPIARSGSCANPSTSALK